MAIPDHEHHVRLSLFHSDLTVAYGLRPSIGLMLRLPYDVKDQRVHYTTLDGAPFDPPYGDIHHRTETLRGFSDGDLVLQWEHTGASHWHFGAGTTLPFGKTVPDPIELGREGLKHEHLQFGSGVFSPEAEFGWDRSFGGVEGAAFIRAVVPVKTNSRGFKAPKNLYWTLGPSFPLRTFRVAVSLAGQYQTVGRWHDEPDEGTGFSSGGVRLQLTVPLTGRATISPSVYRELYSRGFNDETFSQGTTVGLTLRRRF